MRLIDGDKLREQAVDIIGDSAGHKAWAIMSAITMAPTVEPMQWILCSERLPEMGQFVIDNFFRLNWTSYRSGGKEWTFPDVVAWFLCPAPYKGGDADGTD